MTRHSIKWYRPGRKINVKDRMQTATYTLTAKVGKRSFAKDFRPDFTPEQMLKLGVFEGKYLNDCEDELPREWFEISKDTRSLSADPKLNFFRVKSRKSLQYWRKKGWIPVAEGDIDVRGWFQWYCRYYLGRRNPVVDEKQIARWKSFAARFSGILRLGIMRRKRELRAMNKVERRKFYAKNQQALLQWGIDSEKIMREILK
jgi:hypothetical protein